jgi:hypothetical protein
MYLPTGTLKSLWARDSSAVGQPSNVGHFLNSVLAVFYVHHIDQFLRRKSIHLVQRWCLLAAPRESETCLDLTHGLPSCTSQVHVRRGWQLPCMTTPLWWCQRPFSDNVMECCLACHLHRSLFVASFASCQCLQFTQSQPPSSSSSPRTDPSISDHPPTAVYLVVGSCGPASRSTRRASS